MGWEPLYSGSDKAQREYRGESRVLRKEPGPPRVRGSEGDQEMHKGQESQREGSINRDNVHRYCKCSMRRLNKLFTSFFLSSFMCVCPVLNFT